MENLVFNFESDIKVIDLTLSRGGDKHSFKGTISLATLKVLEKAEEESAKVKNIGDIQTITASRGKINETVFDTVFKKELPNLEELFKTTVSDGSDWRLELAVAKGMIYNQMIKPELAKLSEKASGK